ncbi:putative sliding clamp DNA polymerase accessory protein [Rhizobium phage RHph_I46]|uniref:Putative sliding clamp DNA polymerase accessory protein n=1 Tax=Rhizobium phage RHph_I1_9 TaxID=2509729 RepID=A0A7S5R9H4_9CAUD|nr:putative sliding clamp DNA polymerase accessory protein [Rhizobium phage RHph_I1_9]QIG69725.1 putative sliding clamp DNA polymerase accessory protein [Rhizobium phage RHph_I46]QIG71006.1 putative sliding clamp DNA polymerase accessory protein [Rhizobium phage RHph_I9]QIG73592.1 putative sliding clamp DNA polymerase accessory protein [Rhizobium phage RHph_I1_9]QIG76345.1 putative sliding clamp DNA polymerase accessory protein [Rhizobium phage RHph_I34]
MKLETTTISILKHLGSLAESIHIIPMENQRFYVAPENKSIVALAKNVQSFEDALPIYKIKNFVSALELFKDTEYSLEVFKDRVEIKSDDDVFNQTYNLADPAILIVPTPEKTDSYFAAKLEVEFEFSEAFLSKLKSGISQNGSSHVFFECDGNGSAILVRAADASSEGRLEKTNNQFSVKSGHTSDKKFRVAIASSSLLATAPGQYTVGINKNLVRLAAPEEAYVSYVIPSAKFSTYEG